MSNVYGNITLEKNFTTHGHTYRQTKGNNYKIKYAKDNTSGKNNSLLGLLDALNVFVS